MTNTEKERLALLVGDKSITCAKLQQALEGIAAAGSLITIAAFLWQALH